MDKLQEQRDLSFINNQIRSLQNQFKKTRKKTIVISSILGIICASIIVLCLYLIVVLITNYNSGSKDRSMFATIGPQLMAVLISIIIAPLVFFMSLLNGMLARRKYEIAFYRIKTISNQYNQSMGKYNNVNRLEVYKSEVEFVVQTTLMKKQINKK